MADGWFAVEPPNTRLPGDNAAAVAAAAAAADETGAMGGGGGAGAGQGPGRRLDSRAFSELGGSPKRECSEMVEGLAHCFSAAMSDVAQSSPEKRKRGNADGGGGGRAYPTLTLELGMSPRNSKSGHQLIQKTPGLVS